MNRAAAGKTDRVRQCLIEQRIELNRPLGFRSVSNFRMWKSCAKFRDDRRIIDENSARCCRQCGGDCRGERSGRIESSRGLEPCRSIDDVMPAPIQILDFGD